MNLNTFTEKAQEALLGSQELASELHHPQIEPEHLLTVLAEQPAGVVPEVLRKMAADPAAVARGARAALASQPQAHGGSAPALSPRLGAVIDTARREAERLKDEFVSTEHLLLGLAAETGRTAAARVLAEHGVTKDRVFEALASVRGSQRVTDQHPEGKYQALERRTTRSSSASLASARRPSSKAWRSASCAATCRRD